MLSLTEVQPCVIFPLGSSPLQNFSFEVLSCKSTPFWKFFILKVLPQGSSSLRKFSLREVLFFLSFSEVLPFGCSDIKVSILKVPFPCGSAPLWEFFFFKVLLLRSSFSWKSFHAEVCLCVSFPLWIYFLWGSSRLWKFSFFEVFLRGNLPSESSFDLRVLW